MLAPNSRTYLTLRPDSTALRRARTARCPMPPMEPVAATDKAAMKWAEEKAELVGAEWGKLVHFHQVSTSIRSVRCSANDSQSFSVAACAALSHDSLAMSIASPRRVHISTGSSSA